MKKITLDIMIKGSAADIWKVISDIDGSVNVISGIEKVEVLERPESGLTGLKWRETRTMFGQSATEVMWITDSQENKGYSTRAESHGAIYTTRFDIREDDGVCLLTMTFGAELVKFSTRIVTLLTGWIFASATRKALMEDLEDIKKAVEAG